MIFSRPAVCAKSDDGYDRGAVCTVAADVLSQDISRRLAASHTHIHPQPQGRLGFDFNFICRLSIARVIRSSSERLPLLKIYLLFDIRRREKVQLRRMESSGQVGRYWRDPNTGALETGSTVATIMPRENFRRFQCRTPPTCRGGLPSSAAPRCEVSRRHPIQSAVRPMVIVIHPPSVHNISSLGEADHGWEWSKIEGGRKGVRNLF